MPEIAEITVNGQPKKVKFEINGEIYTLGGGREPVIEPLTVTRNGDYRPPTGTDGYAPITVDIPSDRKPEQTKTVTITQNGDVTITPDVGRVLTSVLAKVNVDSGAEIQGYKIVTGQFTESQDVTSDYRVIGTEIGENASFHALLFWTEDNVFDHTRRGAIAIGSARTYVYMPNWPIGSAVLIEQTGGTPSLQADFLDTLLPRKRQENAEFVIRCNANLFIVGGVTYKWIYAYKE